MADKSAGWSNYNNIVNQVAAQRVARLGAHGALASVGNSPVGAYTRVGPSVYGPGAVPVNPSSQPKDEGDGRFSLGTPFSSTWHALTEGINRAGSIIPDIGHEQNVISQQREHEKDLGHNTFSVGNLFKDWASSIGKGTSEALSGKHRDFAQTIQEVADISKANAQAKSQGEARPLAQDVKAGSAYVNPYVKGWAGFGADVVSNPLNLIGAGTIPLAEKGLAGLTKGEKALQGLKTAKIAAPAAKKQIAIKLAGHAIPTGIPAVQLGVRMAASESPKVQKVLEAFRPVGNWINNPDLKADVLAAKSSADALHYQYMHKILSPVFGKFNKEVQKDLLKRSLTDAVKSGDTDVITAHKHIADLAKLMKDNKVSEDLYNYHVPKHLQFNAFDPKNGVSALTEMLRVGKDHEGGISSFLGNVHHAIQKAAEHQKIFNELPSQPIMRAISKGASAEKATAAQVKYDKDMLARGFVKHKSPALAGRYVHKSIVPQIDRVENLLRARGNYMGDKWYVRALDKSNSFVKKVDVGLNPASTARRVLSFVNQQIINGHFDPMMLQKAIAINLKHHQLYRNLETGNIEGLGAGRIVKVGNERIPSAEIFAQGSKRGLFGNFTRSEVRNIEDVAGKGVGRKAGHKVLEKMFNANEHVDNSFRMATFLTALKKAPEKLTLDKKYDWAMNEVRKTHLDFSGLTPFERKYLTRLMPFYAAISRSTPIAYRQLLANPGGVAVLPQAQRDFGQSFGNKQGLTSGAIPGYLLNNGANLAGSYRGMPVAIDQKNDITDAYEQFLGSNDPIKVLTGALSQATPIVKDPAEIAFGQSLLTGAPIRKKGSDVLSYFAGQTPFTGLANREIRQPDDTTGKTTWNLDPTLLRLLGVGTNVVTPRQQKSAKKQQAKKKKHPHPLEDWFTS